MTPINPVFLSNVYEQMKFWLPIITAFSLVISAYRSVKKGIGEWADKLLDNHLSHIQIATEATAHSMSQLCEIHQESTKQILTSLEVLKDRNKVTVTIDK